MDEQQKIDIGNYQNVEKMTGNVQVRGTSISGVCNIGNSTTSYWLDGGYGTTHTIRFGTIENIGNYQNAEKIVGDVQVRGTIASSTTSNYLEGGYGTTHTIRFGTIESSAFGGGLRRCKFPLK